MKKTLNILAALLFFGSAAHAANECYQSKSDASLQVCITGELSADGTGYSQTKDASDGSITIGQTFNRERMLDYTRFVEVNKQTGEPTGCESTVSFKNDAMTVKNISDVLQCGIKTGDYELIK